MGSKILKSLLIVNILASIYFIYFLFKNDILPQSYRLILIIILLLNIIISIFLCLKINSKSRFKVFLGIIFFILCAFNIFIPYTLNKSISSLEAIQDDNNSSKENSILDSSDKSEKNSDSKINNNAGFLLYFSGIDSYGQIDKISRTDADILMAIRPKDKKILMVSIPRDTYVPIAGKGNNQKDKLTHSGIYGINSTVQTINNLFGVNIDYYVRVNFTSVEKIVDLLGGIDVENDHNFKVRDKVFEKGTIHLNGKETLDFARERHSFKDGDIQRGKNQQKVLKALIKKGSNPSIILNMNEYLQIFEEYVRTDMPREDILKLVNMEISNPGSWNIENISLKGQGKMGLKSYAMPGSNLYMYLPDEGSIREISDQIKELLGEKTNE